MGQEMKFSIGEARCPPLGVIVVGAGGQRLFSPMRIGNDRLRTGNDRPKQS